MDHNGVYLHRTGSSSSAVDLTGIPAGIGSAPASPLDPSPSESFSRKRTSWGRVDAGQDPLHLNTSPTDRPPVIDDPFFSPVDDHPTPFDRQFNSSYSTFNTRNYGEFNTYATSQIAPSSASLIPPSDMPSDFDMNGHREDDEAHLTSNMSRSGTEQRWQEESGYDDPERIAGQSPRTRRRTVRYSAQSPLKKTGTAIKSVSHNLRRVSLRVVNLAGAGLENQIRLPDEELDSARAKRPPDDRDDDNLPDLSKRLPIRGRTLGCLGPNSKLRLSLYNFLVYR